MTRLPAALATTAALAALGCAGANPTSGTVLTRPDISLTRNPYGLAPLTALATFETSVPCQVQVRIGGEIEVSKLFDRYETSHSIPIVGLYPERTNLVTLTLVAGDGQTVSQPLSITTGPVPTFLPQIEIETARADSMEPGLNLITLLVTDGTTIVPFPLAFDSRGDIRWYLDLSQYPGLCGLPFERVRDGNFAFGCGDAIYEYSILGALAQRWTVPGYNFHHDLLELPNGNWLAAVDKQGTTIVTAKGVLPSIEDHVIEVGRFTGAIVHEWDLRDVLDVNRNLDRALNGDWLHMNGLAYSESDDSLIISGRIQGVVKVTRDNGLRWILASHEGWGQAGYDGSGFDTRPYLLTAVDAEGRAYSRSIQDGFTSTPEFDWPWGQHAPLILADGRILLFDNGDFRNYSSGTPYSRAVEYQIDEPGMTVRQTWQYGAERGPAMYSQVVSDVDLLPSTQNRLITAGIVNYDSRSYSKMIEVSYPQGVVAFEATIRLKNARATGTGFGQFDLVYRGERLSLYP